MNLILAGYEPEGVHADLVRGQRPDFLPREGAEVSFKAVFQGEESHGCQGHKSRSLRGACILVKIPCHDVASALNATAFEESFRRSK